MEENKEKLQDANVTDDYAAENTDVYEENLNSVSDKDEDEDSLDVYCVNDPASYYPATYVVYGMAIGLVAGVIAMMLTDSRLLLSVCVFIGTLIGYFIKKGDNHEK